MTNKEIYKIWAPYGKKWVDWVRPVPFVQLSEYSKQYVYSEDIPRVDFLTETYKGAAIFVDLPGVLSVEVGVALAQQGYRPIPIFNGTIEQKDARAAVDNQTVGMALFGLADRLSKIDIKDDALPAFLLDTNRLNRYKCEPGIYDNSWDIYHQDIPSAEYFIENGINKIVVISDRLSKDLKKIFYGFQKKKIDIFLGKMYEKPKRIKIGAGS